VSKFDLRDVSERLTASRDTEAVVFEFLGYLQAVRSDWRASLAFYEVSQDALVNVYTRDGRRLSRKDTRIPVDHLPARLVRKFFHPSAFFNQADRRSLLSQLLQSAPHYEVPTIEAEPLRPLCPLVSWESCVCLPLADQEDMLAMLVLASEKKNAFGGKTIGELIPIKAMAAMALAQHLHRTGRGQPGAADAAPGVAAAEFQDRIQRLDAHAARLEQENRTKSERLQALAVEIEQLDKNSTQYKQEMDRVKSQLFALEEQSAAATQHLTEAYAQIDAAQSRLGALQRTVGFMKEVCQVLSQEHDRESFARTLVAWFCEHFGVERCSLMLLDDSRETLRIAAQRGIDPEVAGRVKVRVGQGIAGWVAHNRKPLHVRVREDAQAGVAHTGQDAYNSDSFICVPLIHNNRLCGVMNLSNKRGGEAFEDYDLDRALLAGSLLAITLGDHDRARRSAAWV